MPKPQANWFCIVTRNYHIQLLYGATLGHVIYKDYWPRSPLSKILVITKNKMGKQYIDRNEFRRYMELIEKKFASSPQAIKKYIHDLKRDGAKVVEASKFRPPQLAELSNPALARTYDKFVLSYLHYTEHSWISFFVVEVMGERIQEIINKLSIPERDKKQLLHFAITPSHPASLYLVAGDAHKGNLDARVLAEKYPWITTINMGDSPATPADIRHIIKVTKEISQNKPAVFEKLPKSMREIVLASRDVAYMKDFRDDFRRQVAYYSIPLFLEIGKRLKLNRQDLAFLTREEITAALKTGSGKGLRIKASVRRKKGYIIGVIDRKWIFTDNPAEMEKIENAELADQKKQKNEFQDAFRGVVAYKGIVKGQVCLIRSEADLAKVKTGQIMCAVSTNANYIPAMIKAKAFITDEGGITCHTAIVAREMHKPCIVGAKVATRQLATGDLVEVDANSGIIKVLKRKK